MTIAADGIKKLETRAALILAAVIVLFVLGRCSVRTSSDSAISPGLANDLAHYAIVAAVDSSHLVALKQSVQVAAAQEAKAVTGENAARRKAAHDSARADSAEHAIALASTGSDSAARLWAVVEAQSAEVEQLHSALRLADSARAFADHRADSLQIALTVSQHQTATANGVIAHAVDNLHAAERPCRWAFDLLGCPSRPVAFVGGALAAAAIVLAIKEAPAVTQQVQHAKRVVTAGVVFKL
jgi:hypothetical protein